MKTVLVMVAASLLLATVSFALDLPPTTVQTTVVSVDVRPVALLSAPSSVVTSLSVNCADDSSYGRSVLSQCQGAGLSFTQNGGPHKIVAQATHDSANRPNDMLISLTVDDLSPVILVNQGLDTGPQDLWTGIEPGGYNQVLTWTFDGSLAGTPSGSYAWTVTFTAMAEE